MQNKKPITIRKVVDDKSEYEDIKLNDYTTYLGVRVNEDKGYFYANVSMIYIEHMDIHYLTHVFSVINDVLIVVSDNYIPKSSFLSSGNVVHC